MERLTRDDFLAGALAAGVYGFARAAPAAARRRRTAPLPEEQHALRRTRVVREDGVAVLVPPVHHAVLTARVVATRVDLPAARERLERELARLERRLDVTVGWGLPYFRRLGLEARLPVDLRASRAAGDRVPALVDAIRFPSDLAASLAPDVVLEANDVAILLRGDALDEVGDAARTLVAATDAILEPTSLRRGFVGGGLPRRLALAAGVPGAEHIPPRAQLFLGFTSTQRSAQAPARLVNLETIPGLTDQWPDGYFRGGTTMHLSHLREDLEAWYARPLAERAARAFRPGTSLRPGSLLPPERRAQTLREVDAETRAAGVAGHSASLQPLRTERAFVDNHGRRVPARTPLVLRADFDTLDDPFAWSEHGGRGRAAAGVHFVAFAPTSDTFARIRTAMDGHYPSGIQLTTWGNGAAQANQGLNPVIRATHRQNFLVPPRSRRSFPLVELP